MNVQNGRVAVDVIGGWRVAGGQHADCTGPDWHILGELTDREREMEGRGWEAGKS